MRCQQRRANHTDFHCAVKHRNLLNLRKKKSLYSAAAARIVSIFESSSRATRKERRCSHTERDGSGSLRALQSCSDPNHFSRHKQRGRPFKDSLDVGRSLSADRRSKSKTVAKPGYGDQGDQPKRTTKKAATKTTKKGGKKAAKK